MDEGAFRTARDAMAPQACAFQNALLTGACTCSLAARRNIAERDAIACTATAARGQCAELHALLRQKCAFALKLTRADVPLPHAAEMKLECGGLLGVQRSLARLHPAQALVAPHARDPAAVDESSPLLADVHDLVRVCAEHFDGLANLPYSDIVQSVVAFRIRRRRPGP